MNVDKKTEVSVKKPPLCPLVGSHGEAQQLLEMLKPEANGWKQLSSATCMNMMKTKIENAIYQKGDYYIHINLSINAEDEKGMVAKYRINDTIHHISIHILIYIKDGTRIGIICGDH